MFYQYYCPKCDKQQEEEHSMKVDPIILCKLCSAQMKRVITGGTGFRFKF